MVKGRPMVIPSKQYRAYEKEVEKWLPKMAEPISVPCEVKCLYFMPTRRKCDLTNLLESTDDVLVKHGVLLDDNYSIIESHDGSRVFYDKENPRTEVYIREL